MAVFRIEKNSDFTIMPNYPFRDMRLSFKGRGLLGTMLTLRDDWDYTLAGLTAISPHGKSYVSSGLNELEQLGYSQLFNLLCEKADDVYGGRLPVHVRCLIDECANIGQIPNLEKLMATIRSREISACLVLQAQSQLKALYKDNADTIIGNCDSYLFLGGKEPSTLKELSQSLGRETIDTYNTGESRGREQSHSLNYQKLGRELMSVDDLATMDGGKCILQVRGLRPFLSDKYDITKHPNYKYLSDANPKNTFDVEAYMSRKLKLQADDEYDVYEIDDVDLDDEDVTEET